MLVCVCFSVVVSVLLLLLSSSKMNERTCLPEWKTLTHTRIYKYLHIFGTIHATPLRVIKQTTKEATFCHIKIKFQRVISGFLHFLKLNLMAKELNYFWGLFLNSFDVHVHRIYIVFTPLASYFLQMLIQSRVVVIVVASSMHIGNPSEMKSKEKPIDR